LRFVTKLVYNKVMPKLIIDGKTFEIEKGERLVLAIERSGIPIGHRCGGNGECTTCRVQIHAGEPQVMTQAEFDILARERQKDGVRLSCQIEIMEDMQLSVLELLPRHPEWGGDPGPEPEEIVTPEAVWYPLDDVKK